MIKKIFKTNLKGLKLFKTNTFNDKRGYFEEIFNKKEVHKKLNIKFINKLVCVSFSKKNVIRGFHFQKQNPIDQIVYVQKGKILDVVIDIRKNSRTFGQYEKFILSEKNKKILFMPKGFAHGFCALEKENVIIYNLSEYYKKNYDTGFRWDDKRINIKWPIDRPIVSKKDRSLLSFDEIKF